MDTALKRHGWAARWVKAIFAKGYTQSIDTAHYRRKNKLSRELAQASRNYEVPWDINAEPSRVFFFKKAVDFRAKKEKSVIIKISLDIKKICVNL